jgi:hypothetical protein
MAAALPFQRQQGEALATRGFAVAIARRRIGAASCAGSAPFAAGERRLGMAAAGAASCAGGRQAGLALRLRR